MTPNFIKIPHRFYELAFSIRLNLVVAGAFLSLFSLSPAQAADRVETKTLEEICSEIEFKRHTAKIAKEKTRLVYPLTIEELTQLLIEQKDHHRASPEEWEGLRVSPFAKHIKKIFKDNDVKAYWDFAPAQFSGQPRIPVVVFQPKQARSNSPAPLIVHVHGGPKVHITPHTLHAEIAYFLSHGFVVVAPNFRGSTPLGLFTMVCHRLK